MNQVFTAPTDTTRWDSSVMKLNVETQVILDNISANILKQVPQHMPYGESPQHYALVGGGWSLEDTFEELRDLYFGGVKLIALNGAGSWLMERNLKPSMQIVMDARPQNLTFVEKPIPGCRYFLASQTHPSLFDACEGRDVRIFHVISSLAEEERKILDEFYDKRWIQIPGAGTIGVVGIMLCRTLGFKFQHLFGFDSCYAPDGRHHAYAQKMNEGEGSAYFWCAGRRFKCAAWQASQADNFLKVIKHHGDVLQLEIHGDGLLAHILKTGAELKLEE